MATLLHADGTREERAPTNGRSFTLAELQTFVGGYIEAVYLPDGRVLMVNEDGKRLQLPYNALATLVARQLGAVLLPDDVIVGTAVLGTRAEFGGGDEDVDAIDA